MKKQKLWLIIIAIILFTSLWASYYINNIHHDGKIASIYVGGKVVKTIDLDKVEKPYTFKINGKNGGYNIIAVEKGNISIKEADCPDQVCVHQGKISDGVKPIVCLPHELVIKINGEKIDTHHEHEHQHDHDDHDKADILSK